MGLYKHSCLWSLEEDIGPLGSGMAGACEPPDVVAGDWTQAPVRTVMLLVNKPAVSTCQMTLPQGH